MANGGYETGASIATNSRDITNVDVSELQFIRNIGGGTFANVYLAVYKGENVAVKQYTQAQHMPFFEAETRHLARACHPNIIALYAKSIPQRLLVMEFSPIGALDYVIENMHKYDYTAAHAICWGRQAADGIAYLHTCQVLHRDLKPANMLLFREGQLLKLTDFGTSCLQRTFLTCDRGSPAWMAPEVWHTNDYNEKCDVYSWAVVLWQILSRQQPFNGMTMYQVMWKVINGDRLPMLKSCPTVIQKLITDCWDGDKNKRPSMIAVAKQMAVLQKLYPGGDEPIVLHDTADSGHAHDVSVGSNNDETLTQINAHETISSFETISSIDSNRDTALISDDLGSLAVTGNATNRPLISTLTQPARHSPTVIPNSDSGQSFNMQIPSTRVPGRNSSSPVAQRQDSSSSGTSFVRPPSLPHLSPSPSEKRLLEPISADPNGAVSSLIHEQHVQLANAFTKACAKIEELTRIKQEMQSDLDRIRFEEREAQERVREYQQVSAENEELTSLVTYLESNQNNS